MLPLAQTAWVSSTPGVLAVLVGVCALFFGLEQATKWKLFQFLPPLIFIYFTPVLLTNFGVLARSSPVYSAIGDLGLPLMLVLLLVNVDIGAAIRVMGRGVLVMLCGTVGIVIGAPIAYAVVRGYLGPDGWKAFGTLAGSWIGGTGNMGAVSEAIETGSSEFGLAVLADTSIYILWLPLLLGSKHLADRFARFTGVGEDRLKRMEEIAKQMERKTDPPRFQDLLYLLFFALLVTWASTGVANGLAEWLAENAPAAATLLSARTLQILLITTLGIALSFSPVKNIPGSSALAMTLIYIYVARMGASADLSEVAVKAIPFLGAALLWILIHGAVCLLAAWIFRVDVHTAAIASAANVGGAASAPVVAAYHNRALVPVSILMALIGYAVGNYAALLAAWMCKWMAPTAP